MRSYEIARLLFWYLLVAAEDESMGRHFSYVIDVLEAAMTKSKLGCEIDAMLRGQQDLAGRVERALRIAVKAKGKGPRKVAKLRQILQPGGTCADLSALQPPVHHPLDSGVRLTGCNPETANLFTSVTYPMVLEFFVEETPPEGQEGGRQSGNGAKGKDKAMATGQPSLEKVHAIFSPRESVRIMYKDGDDLRQDQLILQLIDIFDRRFKQVNLDLKLSPFAVLPTSRVGGFMEFIDGIKTMSDVIDENSGDIKLFFRKHAPIPGAEFGIDPEVMDTFIRSCAGYCVITYVLGIGDRHLENLVLKKTGHLIHLDFGWIFGRDPKPWPAPMRLTKEMVDGMGGFDSAGYSRFKAYCCQAYRVMRKSANLLLNLLELMSEAAIKDLSVEQEHSAVPMKIKEKLRLDLVDEAAAETFILGRIKQSATAAMPVINDVLHRIAVSAR